MPLWSTLSWDLRGEAPAEIPATRVSQKPDKSQNIKECSGRSARSIAELDLAVVHGRAVFGDLPKAPELDAAIFLPHDSPVVGILRCHGTGGARQTEAAGTPGSGEGPPETKRAARRQPFFWTSFLPSLCSPRSYPETSLMRTGRCSSLDLPAASAMTTGIRLSAPVTGMGLSSSTASVKAWISAVKLSVYRCIKKL
jgi:hypothetical protein